MATNETFRKKYKMLSELKPLFGMIEDMEIKQ